jgi:ankyrin repeat protein
MERRVCDSSTLLNLDCCIPSMARKKAQRKQETTLVPHRTPDLSGLLERAKSGKSAQATKAYLDAGGSPAALVLVAGEAFDMQVPLLHSMALTNTHPHRELAESVRLLVAAGADIEASVTDPYNLELTALMCAAERTCCTVVPDVLLQAGADPCVQTTRCCTTSLHIAARLGTAECCEFLLAQASALLELKDDNGWSALMYACHSGRLDKVELLIQRGADVHTVDSNGCSALMVDVKTTDVAVVQLLLDHGADISTTDSKGQNALFIATMKGHVPTMELLVQRGLSVTAVCGDDWTLLMRAAQRGNRAAAEWLLQQGVAVDTANKIGATALHIACSSDNCDAVAMVELLIANGADLHKQLEIGRTPLDIAVLRANIECVQVLIAAGADVNRADNDGASSLHVAVGKNNSAAVQLLLEHGATAVVNSVILEWCTLGTQCCSSATALMMCTGVETVQQLLAAGADVHMTNNAGDTCLHVAAKHNWKAPLICLLIKAGADLHAVNNESKTAAQLAHDRGHTLVKLLLIRAARD